MNTPWSPGSFESEPLTKRSWALQETCPLKSSAALQNTQKMYFECNNGIVSEDGACFEDRLCALHRRKESQVKEADHEAWNSLIWTYGDRKLSKPTDKLPALSGLARLFEQRLGAKYVAGLWSDDLIEGLAWQCLGSKKLLSGPRSGYTGPSWSWANYEGLAATGVRKFGFKDIAEIKDWHVEPKTNANPYGEVKEAWIRHSSTFDQTHSKAP